MQSLYSCRRPRTVHSRLSRRARHQTGLTLIEFMVSIVIGMLLVAALATLIASQSSTRSEIDKSGRMIENGRYSVQTLASDIQMAGYWGELTTDPTPPGALSDPCSVDINVLRASMGLFVQGFNSPATLPASLAACVKNYKPGTDVLVVRRVDPDMSAVLTGPDIDLLNVALVPGQVFLQTGMDTTGTTVDWRLDVASSTATANATAFPLKKKDPVKAANLRKMVVHIYYISKCSVEVSGSCTNADGGTPIPTLKRVELATAGGIPAMAAAVTIAEGIENMQFDYGVDSDSDGTANGSDVDGSALTVTDWPNVMTLKVYLLARSTERTASFLDGKSYAMGSAGTVSAATGEESYKRHLFVQSVRITNPSSRRAL